MIKYANYLVEQYIKSFNNLTDRDIKYINKRVLEEFSLNLYTEYDDIYKMVATVFRETYTDVSFIAKYISEEQKDRIQAYIDKVMKENE